MSTATMIDPAGLGATSEPRTVSWTDRDTLLYALAVGAGVDEPALTTENTRDVPQKVLPSFAVIPATSASLVRQLGEVKLSSLLHASQSVRVVRPLPPAGSLRVGYEITDLVDKGEGKHAFVTITGRGHDPESGELVVETAMGLMIRQGGGFGGPTGSAEPTASSKAVREIPDRPADLVVEQATRPEQALLYRLTGDRNPLHSDPAFAARMGFDRPILHGLATYGFATNALARMLVDADPDRITSLSARFAAPVVPGEVLATRVWRTGEGSAVFRTSARSADAPAGADSDERVVLDAGSVDHL